MVGTPQRSVQNVRKQYVCLPDYSCHCNGVPVSYSTMARHRNTANNRLAANGQASCLRDGPELNNATDVIRAFQVRDLCGDIAEVSSRYISFQHDIEYADSNQVDPDEDNDIISRDFHSTNNKITSGSNSGSQSSILGTVKGNILTTGDDALVQDQEQSNSIPNSPVDSLPLINNHSCLETASESNLHLNQPNRTETGNEDNDYRSSEIHDQFSGSSDDNDNITTHNDDDSSSSNDTESWQEDLFQIIMEDEHEGLSNDSDDDEMIAAWIEGNKRWIDLQYRRGMEETAMDDIFKCLNVSPVTWSKVRNFIIRESGLRRVVQNYYVCPGHMCFAPNQGVTPTSCSECGNFIPAALTDKHTGSSSFNYLPLLPRIEAMLKSKESYNLLYSYLQHHNEDSNFISDFYDTEGFTRVGELYGGKEKISQDIFISVSTDGFEPYKNNSYNVWPIVAIIINLPHDYRYLVRNVIPLGFIPGPKQPSNLQSFLLPFINEVRSINQGNGTSINCHDDVIRKIRVHVVQFTGDLPAVQKVAGLIGHNGIMPCRFCKINGVFCRHTTTGRGGHYYYPSKIREGSRMKTVFNPHDLPPRSVADIQNAIQSLNACNTNAERIHIRRTTGIKSNSVLFQLPTISPYWSFPIDLMHLVLNIGKDMVSLWVNQTGFSFCLPEQDVKRIDESLRLIGGGVSSQLGARPKELSKYREWKAAEVKDFILRYSLVVLDQYLPQHLLTGWLKFVKLMDLCHRPVLSPNDIEQIGKLSTTFFRHFEQFYYAYYHSRIKLCKYMLHLLLHLSRNVTESGPLCNYSQYTTERYIGWICNRLHSQQLPASSFFNTSLFSESYKVYFNKTIQNSEEHDKLKYLSENDNFILKGARLSLSCSCSSARGRLLWNYLKHYFRKTYNGITTQQLASLLSNGIRVFVRTTVEFVSEGIVQTFGSFLDRSSFRSGRKRRRDNFYVAVEHRANEFVEIRYARVRKILEVTVNEDLSNHWIHWKHCYNLVLLDWAKNLRIGTQKQIFKVGSSANAFLSPSVENVSIIKRLIGVGEHFVPVMQQETSSFEAIRTSARRKQTYFLDDRLFSDSLLDSRQASANGVNYILKELQ